MDWLILIWAVFVCVVYIGGYFLPDVIGFRTVQFSAVYALILIVGIAIGLLRARGKN